MNIPFTVVLSTELLEEKIVPTSRCENGGKPDNVPVVAGYRDDEDEDEDADAEEDEDDEELDDDWEEVDDEDEDEDEEDEEDE